MAWMLAGSVTRRRTDKGPSLMNPMIRRSCPAAAQTPIDRAAYVGPDSAHPRTGNRLGGIGTGLVGLLILAACANATAPTASPAAPSAAAPAAPRPTPAVTPGAEVAFLERAAAGNLAVLKYYEALVAAATGDFPDIELPGAAIGLMAWAAEERDWLVSHPPAECYAAAWTAYMQMVDAYRSVADLTYDSAEDPTSQLRAGSAVLALEEAIEAHEAVSPALDSMTC